ncbi:MAG: transposase [Planctomycetales bacterium]
MSSHTDFQLTFDFCPSKPVVVETSREQLSRDAGLLPIRQFDQGVGFTQQFAEALTDPRFPSRVQHSILEMTRMRMYGILADYPDQKSERP